MFIDETLTHAINAPAGHQPVLDAVMLAATYVGVPLMVLAVVPQWWARSRRIQARYLAVASALSLLGGLSINQFILLFIDRARPYTAGVTHLLIAPSSDPSFPSDHATAVTAIAATFFLKRRPVAGCTLALAALTVMVSRIYVGTHYVSDVMGGLLTGIAAAMLVHQCYAQDGWLNRHLVRLL